MTKPLADEDAPKRVDPAYSLWVSANAGSGKTHVLIDRIVRLLINDTPPERILCLTFTKAAATEMATRLSDRLGGYALSDDETLRAELSKLHLLAKDPALLAKVRTLFARALETPGGLKIQTIHAFCERLLGRFPIEAGIAPHFEVLDDATRAELLSEAQAQIVESARDGAALQWMARIAESSDEAGFSQMTQSLMGFEELVEALGTGDPEAALWATFGLAPGASEADIRHAACAASDTAHLKRCAAVLQDGKSTDQEKAAGIAAFLAAGDRAAALEDYALVYLKKTGEERQRLATKGLCEDHPWLAEALGAEQARMKRLIEDLRAIDAAELAYAALMLGRRVLERYRAMKTARAALDFDDLIGATVALLERRDAAEWVLYKLDGGLDHILVDEAQDTNPGQWRVISALAQEFFSGKGARTLARTLFVVGDDKQSIYSFQGADPDAFFRMKEEFQARIEGAGRLWSYHIMGKSWRSAGPVLKLVDAVFPETHHHLLRTDDAGLVEFWPTEKPDPATPPELWNLPVDYQSPQSPRARLAHKIAVTVAGWIKAGEILPSQGRAIRPGDVMILVRRRNGFVDEVIRELKEQKIAVAGSDRLSLTEHIAVMDLMVLMRFVLLPEDDLNLATLLKSPLFGFNDDDLFALLHGRTGSAMAALRAARNDRAREAVERLQAFQAAGAGAAPYAFLSEALGPMGGRAQMVARLGNDASDPMDELLRLALDYEHHSAPSLQGFLSWLERGQAEVKRDMEHGRDEVRVMTVHGAKGLEANIVILPDTCTLPHGSARSGFFPIAAPDGQVLPVWSQRAGDAPPCLQAARAAANAAAEHEHGRLLYVALTRARDRLYVCGYQGKSEIKAETWHARVGAAMENLAGIERLAQADGTEILRLTSEQRVARIAGPAAAPVGEVELPAFARRAALPEPPPLRWLAPTALAEGEGEPPARSPLGGADQDRQRFLRGRLIHRLLETLPNLAPDARPAAARAFLALPIHDLSSDAQDEIAVTALRIMEEPRFAPLFSTTSRAEVPVAGMLNTPDGPVPLAGVVDRLAVTDTHVRVIDYKTNRPPPLTAEAVPRLYVRQMAAYRQVLRRIYPAHAVECALLWTEGPDLMLIPDAAMDAALGELGLT